jgi:hypothetical protein
MRRRWDRLARWMLAEQYIVGLADVFGSVNETVQFASDLWAATDILPVRLDGTGDGAVPRPQTSEVSVVIGDKVLGRVPAVEPFITQWDWDRITNNVVQQLAEPARQLTIIDALRSG